MQWENDFDVKEYRPKKRNRIIRADCQAPGADDAIRIPGVPLRDSGNFYSQERAVQIGGPLMTTSEILDFSEGSDSY